MVYCAPLSGSYYNADNKTVHQLLLLFTKGQPSKDRIKGVSRYKDERRYMQALRDHFPGEGKYTRRILEAERMKKSLHHKNERSLSFEMFWPKCQKVFNIYDKEGELMLEDEKSSILIQPHSECLYPSLSRSFESNHHHWDSSDLHYCCKSFDHSSVLDRRLCCEIQVRRRRWH